MTQRAEQPRNAGKTWTEEDDALIVALAKEDKSLIEIAEALGRTTTTTLARMENVHAMACRYAAIKKAIKDHL